MYRYRAAPEGRAGRETRASRACVRTMRWLLLMLAPRSSAGDSNFIEMASGDDPLATDVPSNRDLPWAPAGIPGRLDDNLHGMNEHVRDARLNITALVIAASVQRFERAASEIRKSDIRSTVWIPAVFLNETNYTLCGGGGNGLRHAMRNAWTLIASTGVAMAVFEDDVAYAGSGHNESVSNFVVTSCLESNQRCDLAYLGEWNNFFTTHAIFILPHTAQWLLDLTDSCYPFGVQIDQGMHSRCVHRPGKPRWNCIHPPPFRIPGTFGQGFFVQDRRNVPSSLHSAGNRPIA